ncbi:DUF3592 domain-containing protein [Rudaea sp.]|uniref:DUF3592 domain-containing protein n=1 Tax=Rudaea sp. TaxID=2136325 RepID=UPI0037841425
MTNLASPTPARIALGVPVVVLAGTLAAMNHQSIARLDALATSAAITTGRVTGLQCNNHGRVNFSFKVAGATYYGNDSCAPSCRSAEIGDPVTVTYSRRNPGNFECRPLQEIRELKSGNYTAISFLAAILFVGIFAITRTDDLRNSRSRDWR